MDAKEVAAGDHHLPQKPAPPLRNGYRDIFPQFLPGPQPGGVKHAQAALGVTDHILPLHPEVHIHGDMLLDPQERHNAAPQILQ